jgi:hypothetical protein
MVHPFLGYIHKYLDLKLFYYGGSKTTVSCTLQLVLRRVEIYYEVDYITPGSLAYDITLNIYPCDPLYLNDLQEWIGLQSCYRPVTPRASNTQ